MLSQIVRHVLFVFLMLLVVLFSAAAQEPSTSAPPSTAAPTTSVPQDPKDPQDPKVTQDHPDQPSTGKSKLEKETGTVNDRIFDVLPNYGTVENASNLPPLTSGEKFRLATAGVFDWAAYPFNGILSAIAQAKNDPKEWGQGWRLWQALWRIVRR